jgi:hypothetical protein
VTLVYVLTEELNGYDGGDTVLGVFATEDLANLARARAVATAQAENLLVFGTPESEAQGDDWDRDYHVNAHQVQEVL